MKKIDKEHLYRALKDYRFLIERGYPVRSSLSLVCNRYRLSTLERSMLYRGVDHPERASARREKRIISDPPERLAVDGFNVLFTLASYHYGRPLYIGVDGFLRDTGEVFARNSWKEEVLHLCFLDCLLDIENSFFLGADFFFDSQITDQEAFFEAAKNSLNGTEPTGSHSAGKSFAGGRTKSFTLRISLEVDRILAEKKEGCLATSDSRIIDKTALPVVDLPFRILTRKYNPDFIDLEGQA